VASPFDLALKTPPHADTLSGLTQAELLLTNRRPQRATARVRLSAPPGWTATPERQDVPLDGYRVTSIAVSLRSPAGAKPGFYELKAEAVIEGVPPMQASTRLSVLEGFQALQCPRVQEPPRMDGKLDDACWRAGPLAANFLRNDGKGPAREQTRAWLAHDDKALYVAFECLEGEPKTLIALVNKDGGEVWRDDSVEVFLDRKHDHQSCAQYVVNVLGRRNVTAGWTAAVSQSAASWAVEMAIPFEGAAPKPGHMWGLNLCRTRPARPQAEPEFSSWAYTGGGFHQPAKFGHILFGD
jgi:hypothetical protein